MNIATHALMLARDARALSACGMRCLADTRASAWTVLAKGECIVKSLALPSQPSRHAGALVRHTRTTLAWLAASALVLSIILTPHIGATADKEPPFVTGLLDLNLSDYYLTPRGVIVENSGVIAQPVLLLFLNFYEGNGPIDSVSGTVGIWNSIHSKQRDPKNDQFAPNWNEMDLLSALNVTFLKDWTFTFAYEFWVSPIDAFPGTSHIELKFSYGDHFMKGLLPKLPGSLSINPYINFFIEVKNKTAASPDIGESFYFELGMVPKYVFEGYPLSIEMPTYLLFPGDHFYSQNSTLGVFGTGVKVTAPLTFIHTRYGKWSAHTDLIYKHLVNDGLVNDNATALPPHSGNRNPVQIVGGLTLYF